MAEEEYRELFVAEAIELIEALTKQLAKLETDGTDQGAMNEILRHLHTLKGNSMGMGFDAIAEMAHVMEDLFVAVQVNPNLMNAEFFDFQHLAADKLNELIDALSTEEEVKYKGLRTKLQVYIRRLASQVQPAQSTSLEPMKEEEELSPVPTDEALGNEMTTPESEVINDDFLDSEAGHSAVEETVQESEQEENDSRSRISFSETIQVPTRKADDLMNLIGELLIERDSVMTSLMESGNNRNNKFDSLNRIISDLQYGIMNIRMVKVAFLFNKFTRIVRDVARLEQKEVDLHLEGTQIEIDRNVLKTISDALVHLVRNAVSHGIETEAERLAAGKGRRGKLILTARNENDGVVIEITDDGHGIDHQQIRRKAVERGLIDANAALHLSREDAIQFIFEPGFSNAEVVNEVSGRGVGMDVVKRTVESIGGRVQVNTEPGKGSTISLHLPSNLSVKGALLFELKEQEYAVTVNYTEAVVSVKAEDISRLPSGYLTTYLDNPLVLVFLSQLYDQNDGEYEPVELDVKAKYNVIVVRYDNKLIGLVVDKVQQQQEVVEKRLEGILSDHQLFKSATILGNGKVCLILDVAVAFRWVQDHSKKVRHNV